MKKTRLTLAVVLAALGCGGPEFADKRPNIVMIMADDMGYSDIGAYGGEIDTPALDRLARDGMRFTRYYTNNMCVPTRASLMTGIYPPLALGENATLRPEAVTVAEALQQSGYATYMSGKWHLSKPGDTDGLPSERGFDQFYGTILGAASYFAPATLMRNNESAEADFKDPGYYYTDAISNHAVDWVREAAAADKPFFLYVAYTAAHWPLHALDQDVAKYQGKYSMGWDELRLQRHERMKQLGVVNPAWELSPRHSNVPAWEREKNKAWQERRMEVYAAQVDRMDQGIARILAALDETGEMDNTLTVFQVDNGGCHVEYTPDRTGYFLPAAARDGRPMQPGNLPEIMPGPEDTYQSYGHGWANASNTPFRLFKQHDHEGGILTPLIVHWPGVVEAGSITDQVAHVIDLAPTFLEAALTPHPRSFGGHGVIRMDGKSLAPVLEGERRRAHDALFWKWARGRALRRDRWKLVRVRDEPWELYDIEADGTELNDLAEEQTLVVEQLGRLWQAWEARTFEQRLK
ncbi:MAG: arylsulfatase [bacterium]|nr:arylsulfatase [bacterium]